MQIRFLNKPYGKAARAPALPEALRAAGTTR